MKIAAWNVERLKHYKSLSRMLDVCQNMDADILVLTETDCRLEPEYPYVFKSAPLHDVMPELYAATENRVTIYSKYPLVRRLETFDENTSVCVELETEYGNLIVYGTIIGVFGNRHSSFLPDLTMQMTDVERLSKLNDNICFCGDFNLSFSDNYYFTAEGRKRVLTQFEKSGLSILTRNQAECIDHIAISDCFVNHRMFSIEKWNQDKQLSDHKGIAVSFT